MRGLFPFASPKELVWHVCLEFCFQGSITLEKKLFTKWSLLRAHLGKQIAASNASTATLRTVEADQEESDVSRALVAVLKDATGAEAPCGGARGLAPSKSIPITEEDLLQSALAVQTALLLFLNKNPLTKKSRTHPAYSEMYESLDAKIPGIVSKHGADASANNLLTDLMDLIGQALPINLAWTEFAAEILEFSAQCGGFPAESVGIVFQSKELAQKFAYLRAQYVVMALMDIFGGGVFDAFKSLSRVQEVLAAFKPWGSENSQTLQSAVGVWDAATKPHSIERWSQEWVRRFENTLSIKPTGGEKLSFGDVMSSFVSAAPAFKGKISGPASDFYPTPVKTPGGGGSDGDARLRSL